MKVIFLDIDGVLNSEKYATEYWDRTGKPGYGGHFPKSVKPTLENVLWDAETVKRLREIVDATQSKIVISSTWRKGFDVPNFKEMFLLYDWDAPVISITPSLASRNRGEEIKQWIESNDVENYLILDDDSDMLPEQLENFVNTSFWVGLTDDDKEQAITILAQDHD
jgi:hypothetical protein